MLNQIANSKGYAAAALFGALAVFYLFQSDLPTAAHFAGLALAALGIQDSAPSK